MLRIATRIRSSNLEGEYAFGHTKLSGEWTRDVFDTQEVDHQLGLSFVWARRWW